MSLLFSTPRTRVVELTEGHIQDLVALDSDPEVMRYINGGYPRSVEDYEARLPGWIAHYHAKRPAGFWAVLDAHNRFMGWVHLRPDRFESALDELGYRLRREFWGRGFASEVARAMLVHTFETWKRGPVVAGALRGNRASIRVMEKIGMYREREFVYPESVLPGWSPEERAAVRYRIDTL